MDHAGSRRPGRPGSTRAVRALLAVVLAGGAVRAMAVPVTGRVVGPLLAPVQGVNLDFIDAAGASIPLTGDVTDAQGAFAVDVPAGRYDVNFKAPGGSGLAHLKRRDVDVVGATDLGETVLPAGNDVTGLVTDPRGAPIAAVDLDFRDPATNDRLLTLGDDTLADGTFSVRVEAGTWNVELDPPAGAPFAPVTLDAVAVAGPTALPPIVLPDAFSVSARVVDPAGLPVVDANTVLSHAATGRRVRTLRDHSDATGTFLTFVEGGTFELEVWPPAGSRLLPVLLPGIAVTRDTVLPDIVLAEGFVASGLVVDTSGQPVADVDTDWRGTAGVVTTPSDDTDALGLYAVALPGDTYDVGYDPPAGSRYLAVERPAVRIDSDTVLPDLVLESGWIASGLVVDELGQPVADVNTLTLDQATRVAVPTSNDNSDASGTYRLALPDGIFEVVYFPPAGSSLAGARLLDQVVAGADVALPDVVLRHGHRLEGLVVDRTGAPVAAVDIDVVDPVTGVRLPTRDDDTDAAGFYSVAVPTGTWDVQYEPPAPFLPATVLAVDVAGDLVRPTVVLDREVAVEGRVVGPAGPVPGASVVTVSPAGGMPTSTEQAADAAGRFRLLVREGAHELRVVPPPAAGLTSDVRPLDVVGDVQVGDVALLHLVESIAPAAGDSGGGDSLVLIGRELSAGVTASLGGSPAAVAYVSPTELQLTTGPHPPGWVDLLVTFPDGRSALRPDAFEYASVRPGATLHVTRSGDDVILSWPEPSSSDRVVYGSASPAVFGAAQVLGTAAGQAYPDRLAATRRGDVYYLVD